MTPTVVDDEPRWKRLRRMGECDSPGMCEDPDGEYVRFEDAKAIIEELEYELREAEWAAMGEDL